MKSKVAKPYLRTSRNSKKSEEYRARLTEKLLTEMSRVSPDSPAYEQLLKELKRVSENNDVSIEEDQRQRFEKRVQAIPYFKTMPLWFQLFFVLTLTYLIVLLIDGVGFWFGFDLLNDNPPPAHSSLVHISEYRQNQKAPRIP